MQDDDLGPVSKYSANASSLDISERIAKGLGVDFDREEVEKQSHIVFETIFSDLVFVLDLDPLEYKFQSGVYTKIQAFAALTQSGEKHIGLDMVLDFWVFATTHITTVIATKHLDQSEQAEITAIAKDVFDLLDESHRYRSVRESFLPLMFDHDNCLNLSGGLSRSMIIFILCHEIAHCNLDHLDKPQSHEIELEADKLAAEYFIKLVGATRKSRTTSAFVDEKVAAAPIVLMQLFGIHELWLSKKGIDLSLLKSHPGAKEREQLVRAALAPILGETSRYVLDGISNALGDLRTLLIK